MRKPAYITIISGPGRFQQIAHTTVRNRLLCKHAGRQGTTKMGYKLSSVDHVEWLSDPILVKGDVQRGFGRGSRDLGTPTANLPGNLLDDESNADRNGVYLGFGRVPKYGDKVVKMVANLGRNITYNDVTERVLEAYLMSDIFDKEFYGEEMRLCIIGFMRPEWKFTSIEELIKHIQNDVSVAKAALDSPQAQSFRDHSFLTY